MAIVPMAYARRPRKLRKQSSRHFRTLRIHAGMGFLLNVPEIDAPQMIQLPGTAASCGCPAQVRRGGNDTANPSFAGAGVSFSGHTRRAGPI